MVSSLRDHRMGHGSQLETQVRRNRPADLLFPLPVREDQRGCRQVMASASSNQEGATADILAARRRSAHYGLDPARSEIPHIGDPGPAADALRQLSAPVLEQLVDQIADSPLALVLADRDGRLTRRDAPDRAILTEMDGRCVDLGFSLAEADVGTNGVGTSLETRRPTLVVGEDHYLESFHTFTCANAPIIAPITGRIEGTVGVVCPVGQTGPLLLPTAMRLASQIGDLLFEQATPEERFLLHQFLRRRKNPRTAIATIGQDVLIATPAAQRLLAGVDHAELWEHIEGAIQHGRPFETEFQPTSTAPLHLRCRPLHRGGAFEGAAVEVVSEPHRPVRNRHRRQPSRLGELIGVSDRWQTAARAALLAAQVDDPVLIVGERGTGRLSVAEAIAGHGRPRPVEVFSSAEILIDGARDWVLRARAALEFDGTVIFRRVDHLDGEVAAALAALVAESTTARVIATSEISSTSDSGLALLLDQLRVLQIDLPALRDRRDDIPHLVRRFATDHGRHDVDRQVVNMLYRQPWPGNVTELRQVMRSANAKARTDRINLRHLPETFSHRSTRKPLHGLRQQEADAIVTAISSTATRAEAAQLLGISRATLFRRIKAYGSRSTASAAGPELDLNQPDSSASAFADLGKDDRRGQTLPGCGEGDGRPRPGAGVRWNVRLNRSFLNSTVSPSTASAEKPSTGTGSRPQPPPSIRTPAGAMNQRPSTSAIPRASPWPVMVTAASISR